MPHRGKEFSFDQLNTSAEARFALLQCCGVLSEHLSERNLRVLATRARAHFFAPGEAICRAGQEGAAYCYLLASGEIEVTSVPGVQPISGTGRLIGELAVLDNQRRRTASLRAKTLTVVLLIDYADLELAMSPQLFHALLASGLQTLGEMAGLIKGWVDTTQPEVTAVARDGQVQVIRLNAQEAAQAITLALMWVNMVYAHLHALGLDSRQAEAG